MAESSLSGSIAILVFILCMGLVGLSAVKILSGLGYLLIIFLYLVIATWILNGTLDAVENFFTRGHEWQEPEIFEEGHLPDFQPAPQPPAATAPRDPDLQQRFFSIVGEDDEE